MSGRDHIHTVGDGRGFRRVLLNDQEVKHATYADTKEGVVEHYRELHLNEWGVGPMTERLFGNVRVEFIS